MFLDVIISLVRTRHAQTLPFQFYSSLGGLVSQKLREEGIFVTFLMASFPKRGIIIMPIIKGKIILPLGANIDQFYSINLKFA